jgi:ATP-binding cassette subfamily A (ABC1) protein 3
MALVKQIWTLMVKNWRVNVLRHAFISIFMAFVVPIVLSAFFSFARNLFVPPAQFGIGTAAPLKSLSSAFESAASSGRDKLLLVNSGFTGGDIDRVLDQVEDAAREAGHGMEVIRAETEDEVAANCRSTLRGVTSCFAAVVMRSSPDEGDAGFWNYTIRTDAAFATAFLRIDVEVHTNPQQVYMLPLQRTVDTIIGRIDDPEADALAELREYPFTSLTTEERAKDIRRIYHGAITNFMGVLFISAVIWVTYHMTGFIATERESGMSQLVDAMMPVRSQWMTQAARIISHHLSFTAIYAPAWIISSVVVKGGLYPNTNMGIVLIYVVLSGLAFTSMSILYASFFKKAQLSGITAILASLLLGILAQSITSPTTGVVAVLSALFTPCNFVYFVHFMSRFERQESAPDLGKNPPESSWALPGVYFWVFLIIQIIVYPLLGALIERNIYGTSTKGRQLQSAASEVNNLGEYAVRLDKFTKIYTPGFFSRIFATKAKPAREVVAVNELTLNARKGQIIALLGANGSGKSTTLDAIAGLNKLDGGSITIDGTGGLGIAPQKNVLWDDLTVEEHLNIFNRLKAPNNRATKEEIRELIDAVDLTKKRTALSKTLSGGQKRKLQLGMMLTGGSAVCCVDEVSSGIDPLSRRKVWDILLAERGRRTMILTTHFLDEADLLADHIALLSKGTLRAEGSSVELKDKLGGGYRVHVQKTPGMKEPPVVEGVKRKETLDLFTYISPTSRLSADVITQLEKAGVNEYRFSGPTIEDVFLQLAEEIRDEEAFRTTDRGAELYEKSPAVTPGGDTDSQPGKDKDQGMKLMDGKRVGYVKQAMILFRKRLTVLKRNWLVYALAFLLPIVAAGLTSLFVSNQDPPGCSPSSGNSNSDTQDALSQLDEDDGFMILAGPSSKINAEAFASLFAPVFNSSEGTNAGTVLGQLALQNLQIRDTYSEFTSFAEEMRKNVTFGLWMGDDNDPSTIAWAADLFVTSPLTALQFLDMIKLNQTIQTTWSPFDIPFNPDTGNSLNLIVYSGLALACFPAFFALYPSQERRGFVRGLQYSNGVRPMPLWIAYLLFDFMFVLVSSAIVTALWAGLSSVWYHIEYVFIVLFLYGLAATLVAYVISLFTKTQLATYAWAAVIQVVCFLAYLVGYMCVNTYVPAQDIDRSLLIVHFVISAVAPIGSAMRALFLAVNLFSTACDGNEVSSTPNGILQYGSPILFLIVQILLLFSVLLWLDGGSAGVSMRNLFSKNKGVSESQQELSDEELAEELTRVTSHGTHEDGLRVTHLTKSFGSNTAVDNVSFGIKRGEVFALLGPNGAGKSTTISLIRGDIKPDSRGGGDVFVEEVSVTHDLPGARANLGVCPQHDAIDHMTVREHLEFYAAIRGIPDIEHNVAAVLRAVGLEAFSTRMAFALSGGNKRKLSLGIALMGNPTVVLLDEPSSGLDAASKRIMWKTLATTVPGRSILLTTHSMEEADALASRAGIMARRMLALGSPDNLRHRFGDALHIHLVSSSAPRTTDAEMERVINWIRGIFPSADIEEKTYHGQLRFSVPASHVLAATRDRQDIGTAVTADQPAAVTPEITNANSERDISQSAIGHLVVLLEEHKSELGIGHYSVSPTGLEEVFLSIVRQHNVREEGYEDVKTSKWRKWFLRKQ